MRDNLRLNRNMDKSSRPDGRSKSSAFQLLTDEDIKRQVSVKEEWEDPTTTTVVNPNEEGGETTTTTTDQKGKRTTTKENEAVFNFKRDCYKNGVFLKGQVVKGMLCEKSKDPNYKEPEDEVITEPLSKTDVKETSTKGKKCKCDITDAQGNIVRKDFPYPCDQRPPNCKGLDPNVPCFCTDANGKTIEYPKNASGGCNPKPPECVAQKTETEKCKDKKGYARRKSACLKGTKQYKPGRWDDHYCYCERDKRVRRRIKEVVGDVTDVVKKGIKKCIPKFDGKGNIINECPGVDGGSIKTSMN